jgi:hypothetical protein
MSNLAANSSSLEILVLISSAIASDLSLISCLISASNPSNSSTNPGKSAFSIPTGAMISASVNFFVRLTV